MPNTMLETNLDSESKHALETPPSHTLVTHPTRLFILLILLTSFGLRAYHLDFQSFWSDEGISLLRSSAPVDKILEDMPVEHMPGYFILLHYWLQLVGTQDYAIRFLSLWPSVLSVALIFRLGVLMGTSRTESRDNKSKAYDFGRVAGLASAALMATSAFQVWYAQEARMYTWLLASGFASYLFLWKLLAPNNEPTLRYPIGTICGYILTTTLSVYLHFYGFLVPLTQAVFVIGWTLITNRWRTFLQWAIAGVLVFGLFAPWLPRAIGILEFSGWRAAGDPWQIPQRYFTAYTVGHALLPPLQAWLFWGYITLIALGIITWFKRRLTAGLFVLLAILVPMGVVLLMAINNPDFHERYSIIVSGMIALAAGGGISMTSVWFGNGKSVNWIGWPLSLLITIGLVIGNGVSLQRQNTETSLHKPDFRGAANRIAQNEKPGDIILVDGPDPEKVFLHYYQGDAPVHDLRVLEEKSWEEVSKTLNSMSDGAERIWELLYFHGPGPVQMWTATNGWATDPTYHNDIRITLYGMADDTPAQTAAGLSHNIGFGSGLTLIRSEINGEVFLPNDIVRVSTVWQVAQQLPDYKFSLRLLYEDDSVVQSWDYIPQNWIAPTTMWLVGSEATDQHGILLPSDLLPGQYTITLRLYDPATGTAVDTAAGQDVLLRKIQVVTP